MGISRDVQQITISETVVFSRIGADEGVLMDINAGNYYSLSSTAAFLWKLWMTDGVLLAPSVDRLVEEFKVDRATAQADISEPHPKRSDILAQSPPATTSGVGNDSGTTIPNIYS